MTPQQQQSGDPRRRAAATHAGPRRRTRFKSTGVAIGVTAVVALILVDHETSADYGAVCVDKQTHQRVDDADCQGTTGSGSGAGWYYLRSSHRVPAVGSAVSGGTWNADHLSGTIQRGGLPHEGGGSIHSTTVRGGFGGAFHGISE